MLDEIEMRWFVSNFTGMTEQKICEMIKEKDFWEKCREILQASAKVLILKLPEVERAEILKILFTMSLCSNSISEEEIGVMKELGELLEVRPDLSRRALQRAANSMEAEQEAQEASEKPKRPRKPRTPKKKE